MEIIIPDDFQEIKPEGYTLRGSFMGKYGQIRAKRGKDE